MLNINDIREKCKTNSINWTNHVFIRLIQRNIQLSDVKTALMNGEIIEQYPDDYPYPSCLIVGYAVNNKILHVVCALNNDAVWIITAYYPDISEWTSDFKKRKGH